MGIVIHFSSSDAGQCSSKAQSYWSFSKCGLWYIVLIYNWSCKRTQISHCLWKFRSCTDNKRTCIKKCLSHVTNILMSICFIIKLVVFTETVKIVLIPSSLWYSFQNTLAIFLGYCRVGFLQPLLLLLFDIIHLGLAIHQPRCFTKNLSTCAVRQRGGEQ